MKNLLLLLAFVAQFFVFVIVWLAGTMAGYLLDPLHLQWFVTHPTPNTIRYFTPDGLLLLLALYLIIVCVEAISKRTSRAFVASTAALVCAIVFGVVYKFGWHGV